MRVYLGGFFDTRARLRPIRDDIWKLGHEVVSTWLDEVAVPSTMDQETWYKKLAFRDLAEIRSADMLLLDTMDETPRGGREVEYGFALGRFQGMEIWVIGPMRNVFHRLADRHFEAWEDALEALSKYDGKTATTASKDYDETWVPTEKNAHTAAVDAETAAIPQKARDSMDAELLRMYEKCMSFLERVGPND